MQNEVSSPAGHVLFVDDDPDILTTASLLLNRNGFRISTARNPTEAWSVMANEPMDVVLLDLNFTRGATTGDEGFTHLRDIVAQDPDAVVVVVTGHSGVNIAVAAMRAGASDFVMKPWSNERLLTTLRTSVELRRRRREASALKAENAALNSEVWGPSAPLLGSSPAIKRVKDLISRMAPTDAAVLIYGPAGSGKSLIARRLHGQSHRATGSFIPVDLGVLSAEDAERALFGNKDSNIDEPGAFIAAQGGTLFLDEISGLAPLLQTRLLKALESGRVDPPGSRHPLAFDIRIISATRRTREDLLARGGLNHELLYRLNTLEIFSPPLSQRGEDAVLLAEHFLRLYAKRHGRSALGLTPAARDAILKDPWPGDVRALRQTMERCVIFAEGPRYEITDLALSITGAASGTDPAPLPTLAMSEREMIASALNSYSFNISHAAKALGLSRAALYRRMARYGL